MNSLAICHVKHSFFCECYVPMKMLCICFSLSLFLKLQSFNVKNVCQHGISNLSDLLTVSVSYVLSDTNNDGSNSNDNNKKLDIVVKLLPHDPFGRYFVTINQFDLREIQFYTKVRDRTLTGNQPNSI